MNSSMFTCNSCGTEFKTGDLQRYHMKTEWHRYNLKRRMAQLPPVTSDEFAEKLLLSKQEQEANPVDEFGFAMLNTPNDHFKHSKKKYHHHIHHHNNNEGDDHGLSISDSKVKASQDYKHDELELKRIISEAESIGSEFSQLSFDTEYTNTDLDEDTVSEYSFTSESNFGSDYPTEEDETDDNNSQIGENVDNSLSHTCCLYCGMDNKEVERNIRHMFRSHGLYIPERSYLVDLPGLLDFLINTIVVDYACLCCNYVGKSLKSIRDHMNSKRHCRMPYETSFEKEMFAPFYDYSSLKEKPIVKSKSTRKIHFQIDQEEPENNKIDDNPQPDSEKVSTPNSREKISANTPRHTIRTVVITAEDKRTVSGITEKQYKSGLKKMQQLERRARDDYLRKTAKRINFQPHYRDELLQ